LSNKSLLQLALDLTNISEALALAYKILPEFPKTIIEIGTPLIKSEGVRAIKVFREEFRDSVIVADMKTFDAGKIEARLAFNNGADYTTVLYLAGHATLTEVIKEATILNKGVYVDLMNVIDFKNAIRTLKKYNPQVICLHIGVDTQKLLGISAASMLDIVREVRELTSNKIAVAGGITPETARLLVDIGVDIIIVGGYITKAKDPLLAVKKIYKAISQ